jgi:hypothetical protein
MIVQDTEHCSVEIQASAKEEEQAMDRLIDDMLLLETKEGGGDSNQIIAWDSQKWHYTGHVVDNNDNNSNMAVRTERVFLYVLFLDAINFCFWQDNNNGEEEDALEYEHLATALTRLAEQDDNNDNFFFHPYHMANITLDEMKSALEPLLFPRVLPNLCERCHIWNQVGSVLLHEFSNNYYCQSLLETCQYSAPRIVQWIVSNIPSFRDESVWTTTSNKTGGGDAVQVFFYKRAQIFVGDLHAALQSTTGSSNAISISDISQLTTFADYRVPQLLRHWNVLVYNEELSHIVDCQQEIPANSNHELSIRAATVVAVDLLVDKYNEKRSKTSGDGLMTAVQMDWHLWQVGEKMNSKKQLKPHHRTRTIFY